MTTLATNRGAPAAMPEIRVGPPALGAHALLVRLREESERQVAFSETKLLFREAAFMVERLDAELTRVTAELALERADRRAR